MRIVSPLLKTVVYPTLSSIGAFRLGPDAGLAIVTYHGVTPPGYQSIDTAFDGNLISAETLRSQIRLLKKHYRVVSPEDLLAFLETRQKLPSRSVLLTCDDGLLNCLTEMLPVLHEERVKCLFFVTAASAGEGRTLLWYEELFLIFLKGPSGPFRTSCRELLIEDSLESREQRRVVWWNCVRRMSTLDYEHRTALIDELRGRLVPSGEPIVDFRKSVMCKRFGLMSRHELLQLMSAGMTIGAHTISHPVLSCQNPEEAYKEISQCRVILESSLGVNIWAFAYPSGNQQSVSAQVVGMAEEAGYRAAFLNIGGGLGRDLPRHALPRIHVTDRMSLAEFEAHLSGFYAWLQSSRYRSRSTDHSERTP